MKRLGQRSDRHLGLEFLERRELLAGDLRIVELNYNPHAAMPQFGDRDTEDSDDFEFIEVMNVGDEPLNLRGYQISDGVIFEFGQQFLNPAERLVVTKDQRDFRSRYGQTVRLARGDDGNGGSQGEFDGKLSNNGEAIELRAPSGAVIQRFTYYDAGEWPGRADGDGSSLEVIDPRGDYNDPKNWRPSSEYGGSPGVAGRGFVGDVVINEILTHTDLPQIDAIELFNRTGQPIDMTNWYLSDSLDPDEFGLFRYRIEGRNSLIGANNYQVFDENQLGFSFKGQESDNAFLVEADDSGRPLRFVDVVGFSATQNGISLGRWSNGVGELFPQSELTFEDPNEGPLFDAAIISEVHYHPARPPENSPLSEDELEFIEIYNRAGFPVDLSYWRLRDSVDFAFPEGTSLPSHSTVLVVGFDPSMDANKASEFRKVYQVPDNTLLLGPYADPADDPDPDWLDDDGERLILERPEDIAQLGLGYVLVDRVIYGDSGDWPTEADGQGASLTRRLDPLGYGDFADSWQAVGPTPGLGGVVGDFDGDGVVDANDIDQMCLAIHFGGGNALFDLTRDGEVNSLDFDHLIHNVLRTHLGDANLDGRFDSGDLVAVFAAGQYEDGIARNSGWANGDWNCDGEFDTGDLVEAFREGAYVVAAQRANPPTPSPLLSPMDDPPNDDAQGQAQVAEPIASLPRREARIEDAVVVDYLFSQRENVAARLPLSADAPTNDDSLETPI